jgi:ABC-2 type transport system permease protein
VKKYSKILWAILKNNFQNELAYFSDTWMGIFSSITFSLAYIISLQLFMKKATTIGGYNSNEMLFLATISQVQIYMIAGPVYDSLVDMHRNLRAGLMDFILIKPINRTFFLTFRTLNVLRYVRAFVPLTVYILIVKWSELGFTKTSFIHMLIIFTLFAITDIAMIFLLATKSILGDTPDNAFFSLFWRFHGAGFNVPHSVLGIKLSTVIAAGIPSLAMIFISGAVGLGKMNFSTGLTYALISNAIVLPISFMLWRLAMLKYNSASS